eukprot:COSAG01_NODE_743_length_13881_cov_8.038456_3_plen_502_part_00
MGGARAYQRQRSRALALSQAPNRGSGGGGAHVRRAKTATTSASTVREHLRLATALAGGRDGAPMDEGGDVLLGAEIAARFRPDFEAMLPAALCPGARTREAVWRLVRWVLARSDAGRLAPEALLELIGAPGGGKPATSTLPAGVVPVAVAGALAQEEAQAEAAGIGRWHGGAGGAMGEELLSPFACGALAQLAFDSAAESRELREFFQLLHSLLSAALALGCGELLPALQADAASSGLLLRWGYECPSPYSPLNMGGVLGLLRVRGAAIMVALSSKRALRPTPLSMRRWANLQLSQQRRQQQSGGGSGGGGAASPLRLPDEAIPRPYFYVVRRQNDGGDGDGDVDAAESARVPYASWAATAGGDVAQALHDEILALLAPSARDTAAPDTGGRLSDSQPAGIERAAPEWEEEAAASSTGPPPGGGSVWARWRRIALMESGVARASAAGRHGGYVMEPALRGAHGGCLHCRLELHQVRQGASSRTHPRRLVMTRRPGGGGGGE